MNQPMISPYFFHTILFRCSRPERWAATRAHPFQPGNFPGMCRQPERLQQGSASLGSRAREWISVAYW
jgi:hypothetical protein